MNPSASHVFSLILFPVLNQASACWAGGDELGSRWMHILVELFSLIQEWDAACMSLLRGSQAFQQQISCYRRSSAGEWHAARSPRQCRMAAGDRLAQMQPSGGCFEACDVSISGQGLCLKWSQPWEVFGSRLSQRLAAVRRLGI